jgi:hypothetical protein
VTRDRGARKALEEIYGDPGPGPSPFQITAGGIWLPTPLEVLLDGLPLVRRAIPSLGAPGGGLKLLDAGSGDGRVLACLGIQEWGRTDVAAYGVECDEVLCAMAIRNLARLSERGLLTGSVELTVHRGDFLDGETYRTLGLAFSELDLIVNYPDGNEERLGDLLLREGEPGRTRLLVVSPDSEFGMPRLKREWQGRLETRHGAAWTLTVYVP